MALGGVMAGRQVGDQKSRMQKTRVKELGRYVNKITDLPATSTRLNHIGLLSGCATQAATEVNQA